MEQIIAILKALGIEVPEDKKETLVAEMKKVFATTQELEQKKQKIATLEAEKKTLSDAQTDLQGKLTDLQASAGDTETYKNKITELTEALEAEKKNATAKEALEQLSGTVDGFLKDKHFVNDITASAVRSQLVEKLQSDAARGHGVSELFDSIVKDEKGEIKPNILIDEKTIEMEKKRAQIVGAPFNTGGGQTITKEEFAKLNITERTKLKEVSPELYDSLRRR